MRFVKFHGYGNDYIVFEAKTLGSVSSLCAFARHVCEPHYGAGADGIAIIGEAKDETTDFRVRIFNPDGSEAGLSGNGTRCAAAYIHREGLWSEREVRLQTSTRTTRYVLRETSNERVYIFDSELGRPTFDAASIPMNADEREDRIVDFKLELASGEKHSVTALSVGNPHCVIFVEDFEELDWRRIGAEIERHELFPERTNVEFVRVLSNAEIELRIWERGVGETNSSGTCASAATVASVLTGRCVRSITVRTPGGSLPVEWRETDDVIVLTGSAEAVYEGVWLGGTQRP